MIDMMSWFSILRGGSNKQNNMFSLIKHLAIFWILRDGPNKHKNMFSSKFDQSIWQSVVFYFEGWPKQTLIKAFGDLRAERFGQCRQSVVMPVFVPLSKHPLSRTCSSLTELGAEDF